ncbi:MAG: acyl transferase [Bacteroidota bacterium]
MTIKNPPDYNSVFTIKTERHFEETALEIFAFQYANNPVYREFVQALGKNPSSVNSVEKIPFLPVEFFKSHKIISGDTSPFFAFESSGTTAQITSRHYVIDPLWYEKSFTEGFRYFFGDVRNYRILALLPSYQERENSSLVYMAERLINDSKDPDSGFYLDQDDLLLTRLTEGCGSDKKTLLLGVSFALLDLAEKYPQALGDIILMETGGMKGRREELTREDLHERLGKAFQLKDIFSEYGMTELFSQAYSKGNGVFHSPPWMKILIRDPNDPLAYLPEGRSGGINIIDLANVYSCSFIATQDLGKCLPGGGFEVSGRFDHSDVRGCNLLVL